MPTFIESLHLRPEHGYCGLAILCSLFANMYGAYKVGSGRKKYNVQYPAMYAEASNKNAKLFNCIQRAHQNLLENLPTFFLYAFFASIYRPEIAAVAIIIRVLGFFAYVAGYSTGVPSNRRWGMFGYLGYMVMIGLAFEVVIRTILNNLV